MFCQDKWIEELRLVKEELFKFFSNRMSSVEDNGVRLVTPFEETEVKEAIWDWGGGCKSPNPDSVSFNFIKSHWHILKKDFTEEVQVFHSTGILPKGCNSFFITFIAKSSNPQYVDEYKPLVGCIYKAISNFLSIRIKKDLEKVIDSSQYAFLSQKGIVG